MHKLDLTRIGCSDAATILGLNPWSSPWDLWARIKHGQTTEVGEAAYWGTALEWIVASRLVETMGYHPSKLFKPPSCYPRHRGWQRYSLDPVILLPVGQLPALITEIKVRSSRSIAAQGWRLPTAVSGLEPSHSVIVQVQAQMEALRADRDSWRTSALPDLESVEVAVLIDGQRLVHGPVRYDAELAGTIVEACERFWQDHIIGDCAPEAGPTEACTRLLTERHPRPVEALRDATPEELMLLQEHQRISQEIKRMEEAKHGVENKLRQRIGGAAGVSAGWWKATWSRRAGSPSYARAIESLVGSGDLSSDSAYRAIESTRGPDARVLRVSGEVE